MGVQCLSIFLPIILLYSLHLLSLPCLMLILSLLALEPWQLLATSLENMKGDITHQSYVISNVKFLESYSQGLNALFIMVLHLCEMSLNNTKIPLDLSKILLSIAISTAIGLLYGISASWYLKYSPNDEQQIALIMLSPVFAFLTSEALNGSGLVSVILCASLLSTYARHNLQKDKELLLR